MNRHSIQQKTFWTVLAGFCLGAGSVLADEGYVRPTYPAGFAPGTRVVLLADAPTVGEGLRAGMSGTIICCDTADCTGSLLVSWDLWTGGRDDEGRCVTSPVGPYPAGSATWVNPKTTLLGRVFDKVGILHRDAAGCSSLVTEDGQRYHLIIGPEFFEQWPVVLPGNGVRVRGLLNASQPAPEDRRDCPQFNGDVYHPILTDYKWTGDSCCDPFVCGFLYGDRVVLIGESNPNGAVDLPRGASGTIICCNARADNSVLVSWDLWTNGGDPNDYMTCNERLTGLFPPASTWWVPVRDLAKCIQTHCGDVQELRICSADQCQEILGVGLFIKNEGLYYLPDLAASQMPQTGGEFLVSGLFAPYAALPTGLVVTSAPSGQKALAAVILHSVLLPCPLTGCCVPAYTPGDRVRLLVDEPGGAEGLFIDAGGKVICCNANDPCTPILVSWDLWTNGHDDDETCTCCLPIGWYRDKSAWWMSCKEIEPIVKPDLYDAGESYRGFTPPSVAAGVANQGLAITGMIANRGGSQSGYFFVEIYASLDDEITYEDYFIGLIGMDIEAGGISELFWAGTFPTNIPPGSYYIGWLIDPDDFVLEARENNNTAVIQAGKLVVTGP
ncbi:MAG TPA: CARDB domain-containing protein [Sedimentisphaerales bacterium]|nr:CARDB domain-containing protein [Sedimentisphaerales bacterium]HQG48060.1 CARDB domain-containing protein [Sedimentisphaerales bacterium]